MSRYKKMVGLKGGMISGGQKQRIAIARAIMLKPPIYLFDEATSALDSESEKVVQESLDRLQQNGTTLTVAHRFSTIKNSDVIYALENGRVKDSGTFDELRKRNVIYE